jgi:short subunit dehydrogenase-like uncharacterized protein
LANAAPEFDLIVYGASGFTGRLIADYLGKRGIKKWAMGGRSLEKLAAVRDELGLAADTPLVAANSDDALALKALCERTRVVITTVGPYQAYGDKLVAACAATGTDYVDLCGEPGWMRAMIDAHHETAQKSGARIVFSCGFDSIPFDLGVWFLQEESRKAFGKPSPRVKGRVRKMQGGVSGGTAASLIETMKAVARDPSLLTLLKSPFALTPGFEGPDQPLGLMPEYDSATGTWAAPFIMATINTKNVHRTNFLLDHAWGKDFVYDEMIMTSPGEAGKAIAEAMAAALQVANPFGDNPPKPGEGPSKDVREAGFYEILYIGETAEGQSIRASVGGKEDPGYASTSKMIAESALTLLETKTKGGVFTPGGIIAAPLLKRLETHAGLIFQRED